MPIGDVQGSIIRRARLSSQQARALFLIISFLAGGLLHSHAQDKSNTAKRKDSAKLLVEPQIRTKEGISVEFSIQPIGSGEVGVTELQADSGATVRFKIVEAYGGKTLSNLRPAAWIDRREGTSSSGDRECREKIRSFLQHSFSKRASIDLNTYFILALNQEPNISVIDPLSGFGGTKLYTLVVLASAGEDWELSADKKRLYVSMPDSDQVAVIDTAGWKVIANLGAGPKPSRLALQHDGRYLWVANDASRESDGGVTVIDTATSRVAAHLKTGAGHHEIAVAEDDSFAFVTNRQEGTLSVIDVRKLAIVKNLNVGSLPSAVSFSALSKNVYVASEGDGTITGVDSLRLEIVGRMKAAPGLRSMRIAGDGRFGFVTNSETNTVYIFDVSSNRLLYAVPAGSAPDQLAFTRQFAYVHSSSNAAVTMIKLEDFSRDGQNAAVTRFSAGEKPPKQAKGRSIADLMVPAPEEGAVLVANPADSMIYYYSEGMAAPMGSFQNYQREPKALLVLDNSLAETASGVYTTTVRLGAPGHYDVAFLLDSPRFVNCFDLNVIANPEAPQQNAVAIKVEPLLDGKGGRVGESYNLRFRIVDSISNEPKPELKDVGVLVFLAPGVWQRRELARPVGNGVYEMAFVPPKEGVYYFYFQCPTLAVRFNQITPVTVQVAGK